MNHPKQPIHARHRKTPRAVWFVMLAGALTITTLLSPTEPLASPSIALGQAVGNEAMSTGRFEAIQVGTGTATVLSPGPTTPPHTTGPGTTAPSETATPTITGTTGSPAEREATAPAASPTATQAGLGISLTTATPPTSSSDTALPPVETTSLATAKPPAPVIGPTGTAPTVSVPARESVPTQSQPPGPTQAVTARPGSPAAPITPVTSPTPTGSGSSPILLILGGIFIVGIGILAYFIGRRG